MTHIMIDLETFGLGMDAPVVAIGACSFSDNTIHDTFRATIPLKDAIVHGAVIDPDTVEFWLQASDEARAALLVGEDTMNSALMRFAAWLDDHLWLVEENDKVEGVWGNGAAFDNALLRETYHRAGISCPWSYKLDRCFRTVKEAHGMAYGRRDDLIEHDAVHDAVYQAEWLMAIWRAGG